MALLIQSPRISLLSGKGTVERIIPRRRNFRFSVCSGVKDLEKEGLNLRGGDNCEDSLRWWLYGQVKQSETAPLPTIKKDDEDGKKQDYYVNAGYAIRTIREEFPELFYKELSFDIYRYWTLDYFYFWSVTNL